MDGGKIQGSDVRNASGHGCGDGVSKTQESSLSTVQVSKCCQDKWLQECKEIKDLLQKILQAILEDSSDSSDSDTEVQKSDLKAIQEQSSKHSSLQGKSSSDLHTTSRGPDISGDWRSSTGNTNPGSDWRRQRFEGYRKRILQ